MSIELKISPESIEGFSSKIADIDRYISFTVFSNEYPALSECDVPLAIFQELFGKVSPIVSFTHGQFTRSMQNTIQVATSIETSSFHTDAGSNYGRGISVSTGFNNEEAVENMISIISIEYIVDIVSLVLDIAIPVYETLCGYNSTLHEHIKEINSTMEKIRASILQFDQSVTVSNDIDRFTSGVYNAVKYLDNATGATRGLITNSEAVIDQCEWVISAIYKFEMVKQDGYMMKVQDILKRIYTVKRIYPLGDLTLIENNQED